MYGDMLMAPISEGSFMQQLGTKDAKCPALHRTALHNKRSITSMLEKGSYHQKDFLKGK